MAKKDSRKQHKDEVREYKAAASRRAHRAALARRVVVVLVLVALVGGGVLLLTNRREDVQSAAPSPAASQDSAADCGPVKNVGAFDPSDKDGSHEGLAPLSDYPSTPPASGPHVDDTVDAGVYDAPVDLGAAIHSLEHGAVTIWYAPSAAGSPELAGIEEFVKANDDHTIVAPYDYPDEGELGSLPKGTDMTLTAWHYVQNCKGLSLPAVQDFLSKYRTPPLGDADYQGEAPEPNVPI